MRLTLPMKTSEEIDVIDVSEAETYEYFVCGLRLRSNVFFPLVSLPLRTESSPDVEFTLKPAGLPATSLFHVESVLGSIRNGAGIPSIAVSRVEKGYLLDCKNGSKAACFFLSGDCRKIECYPEEGMTRQDIECWLFGLVLAFVLQKRGIFSLHGAAVECFGRAVGFLGSNGFGKSTLAFFFLRQGHQLVTDDVLALVEEEARFKVLPACPSMNLWPNTLTELGDEDLDIPSQEARTMKSRLSLRDSESAFCSSEVPLERLYLLNPMQAGSVDERVHISRIPSSSAVLELFRHTRVGSILGVGDQKRLLQTFARLVSIVPVCKLRYPAGFEKFPAIYDAVLQDIAA